MSDVIPVLPPGTVEPTGTVSTALTAGSDTASGGGKPSATEAFGESLRDVLTAEMAEDKPEPEEKPEAAEDDAPEEKPDDKPEKAEKAEDETRDEKPEKDEPPAKVARQGEPDRASSEDDRSAPPARIAEDAKRFWRSTPRAMKAEFQRLEGEINRLSQESGPAMQFHQELRDYDQQARQMGTTVRQALDRYVAFDRAIQQDFGQGVAQVAQANGKSPQEAVASVLRAYGMTPQQFAQAVQRNPQAFQVAPQAPRDPAIQQIAAQQQAILQRMQEQELAGVRNALRAEVAAWAKDKPDYARLENAVAEVLQSGIIERIHGSGLSVSQRLDAAYRMAGGSTEVIVPQAQEETAPADVKPDPGRKSVRGAPSDGVTPASEDEQINLKEFLRREMRKLA